MEIIEPQLLLSAYAQGYFPMGRSRRGRKIDWYQPEVRGVIPIDRFHLSKNTTRLMNKTPYEIKIDAAFRRTMEACAERSSAWISDVIIESYCLLNELGFAHSVEIYEEGELTGGLYGVALCGAFFGESMFQRRTERAKFALSACHARLTERGYRLWDTQYYTPHLGTFGCAEMPQTEYMRQLEAALKIETRFGNCELG